MHVFPDGVISARIYYAEQRLDTLPIMVDGKRCPVKNWPDVSSDEAWLIASEARNIGIRCGGERHFAVIDCDDKKRQETFNNVINYLAGQGINESTLPIVQTASGIGRHIYFTLPEYISGSLSYLSPQIGSGEFRYGKGAYVLAPPSFIEGHGGYTWLQGDVSSLPLVEYSCIAGILDHPNTFNAEEKTLKDTRSIKFTRNQKAMLNGIGLDKYASRSEFEYALIVSLVNTGWDWIGILNLFNRNKCGGKYSQMNSEDSKQAYHYLRLSYENASQWAETNISEGRKRAQDAEAWALSRSWPGRGGSTDKDVFLAHAQIANESGQVVYHADCRTLAEFANTVSRTAARANRRLVKAGLLNLEIPAVGNCAAQYSLSNSVTLPHSPIVRKCDTISREHDVFSYQALGKSSKFIRNALEDGPKTVEELVLLTGRTKKTVEKWLKAMSGLKDGVSEKPMVYANDERWYRNQDISLDRISELLEVNGVMDMRKKRHQEERAIHNKAFMRNSKI